MKYNSYSEVRRILWRNHIDELGLNKSDHMVVFGCGDIGTKLLNNFNESELSAVLCLADNNKDLWGSKRGRFTVVSPKDSVDQNRDAVFIIAIARNTEEIKKQLMSFGVPEKNIRILRLNDDGVSSREYLLERLGDKYLIDDSKMSEPSIPIIVNKDSGDRRDFRIYIEDMLSDKLDSGEKLFEGSLMDDYERSYGKYIRLDDLPVDTDKKTSTKVMITCSHKDYAAMESDVEDIYVPVQVGAALTDVNLYELKDNTGDNISDRNYNYCECSSLYWAWKNGYAKDEDYLGLRHYRRRFEATNESLRSLKENGIDIVHLDPIFHADIRFSFVNHTKNEKDWDVMKEGIHKLFPEYDSAMEEYENQHFICGYNMNILRRDVFDEYCEFLFGVLMYIENYYLSFCDRRDRYLGFLAENLFCVFLIKNKDKYTQAVTKLVPYIKY